MTGNIFEQIKKVNDYGQKFWSARDIMAPLGYIEWRKFEGAIERAKEACKNSDQNVDDHFARAANMVAIGSGAERSIDDYHLSRYACYLIAQNGDPRKDEIARAQTYFAIQTRRQEVHELAIEDSKRIFLRDEMKVHNSNLAKAAKAAGVMNYANFQDFGYMGLYGGMRQRDIHARKHLLPKDKILDHMGSEELAANLFRATQAEAKLKRESIVGEEKASIAHFDVGKKVRQTIQELGGTMPEQLSTPDGIKESKKRIKQSEKKALQRSKENVR
ncbi:DNA damage-inducible protein D [Candidatus Wirthbacteria bacterium CG2_30_54_11]|uniref:DNA damage-inducible protein D n=1 Tax=Candidatus Wirthbacteria bacterium CG2_30_54_11 TaxID=1817892 RepID=A0A1J5IVF4_9BACT|nr:MAG: DNA damage-inducible protein D [Candidatus Wirthbacteria bacterium CG2_30_54_11]